MRFTQWFKFKKPEPFDTVNINDLNDSFDLIDEKLKETVDENKNLLTMFKNLIINAGNSNAEVAASRGDFDTLPVRLNNFDAALRQKATEKDLSLERERINNLAKLQQGSTTGDAELADGRVGAYGVSYKNIGESIREQVKTILKTNTVTKIVNLTDSFNGNIIHNVSFLKNQEVSFIINSEGVLQNNCPIYFGYTDLSGINYNNIVVTSPNIKGDYKFPNDCKTLVVWIDPKYKLKNGEISLICTYNTSLYEDIEESKQTKMNYEKTNKVLFGDTKLFNESEIYKCDTTKNIDIKLPINLQSNTKYYLTVNTDCIINNKIISLAIGYSSGEQLGALSFYPNQEVTFLTKNDSATFIRLWVDKSNLLQNGNLILNIRNYEIPLNEKIKKNETSIDNIKLDIEELKNNTDNIKNIKKSYKFSIIGDSYSTYLNWIPKGYNSWYKDSGNANQNNVTSVKDTWWWKLSKETGYSILTNSSLSGSTICNTGYDGGDYSSISFITRVKKDIGEEKALVDKPNIIFIFGGANDDWAGVPLGEPKYSSWNTEDLKSLYPAFCYLIDYLKLWNPQARIINLVNDELRSTIATNMINICNHYGIEYVKLSNIEKESGHPNVNGMEAIKNQVLNIL